MHGVRPRRGGGSREAHSAREGQGGWYPMKRIYGFILGLAVLAAPMAAMSALASADPTTKPMDYQQVTDTVVARGLAARGIPFSWAGGGVNGPTRGTGSGINTVGF